MDDKELTHVRKEIDEEETWAADVLSRETGSERRIALERVVR